MCIVILFRLTASPRLRPAQPVSLGQLPHPLHDLGAHPGRTEHDQLAAKGTELTHKLVIGHAVKGEKGTASQSGMGGSQCLALGPAQVNLRLMQRLGQHIILGPVRSPKDNALGGCPSPERDANDVLKTLGQVAGIFAIGDVGTQVDTVKAVKRESEQARTVCRTGHEKPAAVVLPQLIGKHTPNARRRNRKRHDSAGRPPRGERPPRKAR